MKGLFEKEFLKLGFKKADMKLNLHEMRNDCKLNDKNISENELMMTKIKDLKTARKLGFLILTDNVDGTESQIKSNEMACLNVSCKASPKNLRSKEKTKGKRPRRQPKVTEKELVMEKMSQGKKLTMSEIALIDPEQFARARADREYERSDEKSQHQISQKYHGNPTYAILEIESKLKLRQSGSVISNTLSAEVEVEPIKGYTKQMMDILKKQQLIVEQQILPSHQKRNRDGLRNVIKPTKKNVSYKNEKVGKTKQSMRTPKVYSPKRKSKKVDDVEEAIIDMKEASYCETKITRHKRVLKPQKLEPDSHRENDNTANDTTNDTPNEIVQPVKRKRGRPKSKKIVIEPPETEEDSVYYDIPGEGSNYDAKEMSEDENAPEIVSHKRSRNTTPSSSVASASSRTKIKRQRGRYSEDDDYDLSTETDEATNMSSVSNNSEPLCNARKPRQIENDGIITRNKIKSRSTSRTAAAFVEGSDQSESEISESEYEMQSDDSIQDMEYGESGTGTDDEDVGDTDTNDSIEFKYSPITKTRQTRRNEVRNVKNVRGK